MTPSWLPLCPFINPNGFIFKVKPFGSEVEFIISIIKIFAFSATFSILEIPHNSLFSVKEPLAKLLLLSPICPLYLGLLKLS